MSVMWKRYVWKRESEKKKDGTLYKDYFYYACKHRRLVDGHKCGYRKQWSEDKINNAVEEVIRNLVQNPKFEEAILNKIGSRIDTEEIEKEIEGLEKQHRQLTGAKARLGQQMTVWISWINFMKRNIRIWKHGYIVCMMKLKVWKTV